MTRSLPRRGAMLIFLTLLVLCAACSESDDSHTESSPAATFGVVAEVSSTPAVPAPAGTARTAPPVVQADPSQAGVSLELLGQNDMGGHGFGGNVRAMGSFAYVGSWGMSGRCPALGVRIVDLTDPSNPTVVATAARFPNTSAEDVVPVRVSTPSFTGDLLLAGIQRCGGTAAAPGGLAIVDVTDPRNPVSLSFFDAGGGVGGVHEFNVLVRDDRVFALLAVPYSERVRFGDFRIVEITDPRNPEQVAHWGARSGLGITEGVGCSRGVYAHSVTASRDGSRAYLSYWDAEVIVLDISNITMPQVVTRLTVNGAEGAIHSIAETPSGLLLVAEEDDVFSSPRGLRLRVQGSGIDEEFAACEAENGDGLDAAGVLNASLADGGSLCDGAAGTLSGAVALADEGGCSLGVKARQARAAGAVALILIGNEQLTSPPVESSGALPVVRVSRSSGQRLRELAGAGGTVQLPSARPWGGLSVWDISNPEQPVRRAYFHTANALAFPPPSPGYFTVHNPLSAGRYMLASWYADGVRVIDLADPDNPREVASYVPPAVTDPLGFWPHAAEVWGVALLGDLVIVSDINSGLYVLRATGLGS